MDLILLPGGGASSETISRSDSEDSRNLNASVVERLIDRFAVPHARNELSCSIKRGTWATVAQVPLLQFLETGHTSHQPAKTKTPNSRQS